MMKFVTVMIAALAAGVTAHMKPDSPCPRGSPLASCGYPTPDYSLSSPIGSGGSTAFPICHHTEPYAKPVATYSAGGSIDVVFTGGAIHNGGHCEFSLSYDGGNTFVVIQTILKTCFLSGTSFSVPIPSSAPSSDKVVFAWSWVNASGNREFYMTCSDIAINGKAGGSISGPPMIHPNYGSGPTIGEFANGGDDGSNYYTSRQNIVVTAGGSASAPVAVPSTTPVTTPAGGSVTASAPTTASTDATSGSSSGNPSQGSSYPVVSPPTTDSTTSQSNTGSGSTQGSTTSQTGSGSGYYQSGTGSGTYSGSNTPSSGTSTDGSQTSPSSSASPSSSPVSDDDYSSSPSNNYYRDSTVPTPVSTTTTATAPAAGSVAFSCQAAGQSPNILINAGGRQFTITCGPSLVCTMRDGAGPFCDKAASA